MTEEQKRILALEEQIKKDDKSIKALMHVAGILTAALKIHSLINPDSFDAIVKTIEESEK